MMRSALASIREERGTDSVDQAVRVLEEEWTRGEPRLERLWGGPAPDGSVAGLAALVKADLRCRFARGLRPSVAEYLERFPALRDGGDRVLSLIYEEFCLREEQGEHPDASSFCARYSRWADSLASQLRYHQMLSRVVAPTTTPPRFPEPGEQFEEYALDRVLGKGGAAQVYLARDGSLGGRRVALKISPDRGQEPSIMGRLDHAHIVPVHSVVFQVETNLRGLCMPFRPGLPLDEVIRRVDPARRPRSARALVEAIAADEPEAESESESGADSGAGWDGYPIGGTYAEGVAWVVMTLARALAHAHARGILHRDVKPANVLLTRRDGPQLLDFNLAHDPHSASQAAAAIRGGTLPYMAPEQLEAFLDPGRWDVVGAAADLYSLGLVLRELLTGQPPETPGAGLPPPRAIRELLDRREDLRVDFREANPAIPRALEAIAARCLASAAADRYPDANALADDLDRFLGRRPLGLAVNPSRRERLANWAWRNRKAIAPIAALLAASALFGSHRYLRGLVPIEGRPEFRAAIRKIDSRNSFEAIPVLTALVEERPDSPVARAYLAFALGLAENKAAARKQLARALGTPTARAALLAWGRAHPDFASGFAALGRTLDRGRSDSLLQAAFHLAEQIDPTSVSAREGAATFDARQEKYTEALKRWDALIDQAERGATEHPRDDLVEWYRCRARDALHWAETHADRDREAARGRVRQAVDDCAKGRALLNRDDSRRASSYDVVQAEALIALGDFEAGDRAADAYRKARSVLDGADPTSPYVPDLARKLDARRPR